MKKTYMKNNNRLLPHIILGVLLLCVGSANCYAQDDFEDEDEVVSVRKIAPTHENYKTREVCGIVVDATTGIPINGALVSAYGVAGYSALTDEKGAYKLNVPTFTPSLYVNCPEYNSVVLALSKDSEQKKASLFPATFSAEYSEDVNVQDNHEASKFQYSDAINIKEDVQDHLGAYAYTVSRNGTPGVGNVMFVQGLNSLNINAQPLVVVDGVIIDQEYGRTMLHDGFFNDILSTINPADIEKVTLVRNATALYGARGANGVLVIETKRSKSLATRITATASAGVMFEPKYISMMDGEQYRGYASEMLKGTGTKITNFKFLNADPNYYYYKQYHNNVDWKDLIYRSALTQNYGINVEGGDNVASYNLTVGYTNAQSNLKYNDMDRLNIRFNTDINLLSKLSVRFDASFGNTTRNIRDDGAPSQYDEGTPTSPSFMAYVKAPFISPYSYGQGVLSDDYIDITDETYLDEALANYSNYNYKIGNPLALNVYGDAKIKNHFENSILNIAVTPKYQFNPHLSLLEHFSYSLVNTNEKYYIPINGVPTYYVASVSAYRENEVRSLASKQMSIQSDTRLSWSNRYNAHDISAFGGLRMNFETYTNNAQLGYNTGSDKTPFMSSGLLNAQDSGVNDSWRTVDAYLQANYNYLGRYYLQGNLTATGSSRFGKDADGGMKLFGAVWGIFPSVQASWVISNEPWFHLGAINYLRLTTGYDVSGNDDIDYYAARSYFSAQMFLNAISGLTFNNIGNTNIKWETTRRFNAGLEANLFNNRINLGVNYFTSNTSDLLSMQTIGFLSGISENWVNSGELKNSGFNASIVAKAIATKDWSWEVGASIGHYKNEITSLAEDRQYIDSEVYGATIRTMVGSAANLFYGYKAEGVFATSEDAANAGLYILADNGVDKNYFGAGDVIFR
ncbi:MAG: SusC/RagA family TonB-linked outer membrane protein, partial [Prevotellaceae bacterium]|nr:SusC/RagA family TonB-linked outer membrane protein [Prevotellaceae bacterium]